MRYYDITIGNLHYTTLEANSFGPAGMSNNPNALRVQFRIEKESYFLSSNTSFVRIYGVPLSVLQSANTLIGQNISINAGFSAGLPLATFFAQECTSTLLGTGLITACAGNWYGTEISLDVLFQAANDTGSSDGGGTAAPAASGQGGVGSDAVAGGTAGAQIAPSRLNQRVAPIGLRPRLSLGSLPPRAQTRDDGGLFSSIGSLAGSFDSILSTLAGALGGGGFMTTPANLIHNLQIGMPLSSAIQQTLSTAFKGMGIKMLISNYSLQYQDAGFYQSLQQYNGYLKQLSTSQAGGASALGGAIGAIGSAIGGDVGSAISSVGSAVGGLSSSKGSGIDIFAHANNLIVTDWTQAYATVQLSYADLIGQPTWINATDIQFQTILRGDLVPSSDVSLSFPATIFGVTASNDTSNLNFLQSLTTFSGTAQLYKVVHVGDSRSPDGMQWRTDCWAHTSGQNSPAEQEANISPGNVDATVSAMAGMGGLQRPAPQTFVRGRKVRRYG
jgi:hypothetical protein